MMDQKQKTEIRAIIREMIERDPEIIAVQIANEINRRLGISITKNRVSDLRREMGLGTHQLLLKNAKEIVLKSLESFGKRQQN